MDYEQKYNKLVEAVKELQEANPSDEGIQNWVNDNVPELAESEDERIRKELIEYFRWNVKQILNDFSNKECIAWLEKQGKQKHNPALDIEIPFGAKDSELQEATYFIPEGFHAEIKDDEVIIKKGKQKPSWSEEDDSMFQSCIGAVATNDYYKGEEKEQIYDWLKSLKQRIGG